MASTATDSEDTSPRVLHDDDANVPNGQAESMSNAPPLEGGRSELGGRRDQPQPDGADYEKKYTPDPYGHELDSDARVWSVFNDETQIADAKMTKGLKVTIDTLLVFAGLFSAVVTTFVAQSSSRLEPDYAKITASLVYELVLIQRAAVAGIPTGDVPMSQLTFNSETYKTTDLWVNGLWLTSLTLSLLTALFCVLSKQWIECFNDPIVAYSRDRALIRQLRLQSFERWKVPLIIGFLPVLLSIALLLFMAGLAVYTMPMNSTVAFVVVGCSGATILIYAISIILPVFVPHCAYKTPVYNYSMALLDFLYGMATTNLHRRRQAHGGGVSQPEMRFRRRENKAANDQRIALAESALVWLCKFPSNKSAIAISMQAVFSCLTQISTRNSVDMQKYSMRWTELRLVPFLVHLAESPRWKYDLRTLILDIMAVKTRETPSVVEVSFKPQLPSDADDLEAQTQLDLPENAIIRITVLMRERARLGAERFRSDSSRWQSLQQAVASLKSILIPVEGSHAAAIRLHPFVWRDLELAISYCLSLRELRNDARKTSRGPNQAVVMKVAGHPLAAEPIRLGVYAKARGWKDAHQFLQSLEELDRGLSQLHLTSSAKSSSSSEDSEVLADPQAPFVSPPSNWPSRTISHASSPSIASGRASYRSGASDVGPRVHEARRILDAADDLLRSGGGVQAQAPSGENGGAESSSAASSFYTLA